MKTKGFDINRILKKNSSRHHYIPRFLLEGFANSDGLIYIYDKNQNKILDKPRPPKSVFYEPNRNNIELRDSIQISIIEDYFYSNVDNISSEIVKYFKNEELNKIEFTNENIAKFLIFLITLFWRIPKTDFTVDELMNRSVIINNKVDSEILRKDPTFRKLKRIDLINHHFTEMMRNGLKVKRHLRILESENDTYVIGDYPLLFKRTPSLFSEFNDIDYLIAISSKRIYSSSLEIFENFTMYNSFRYNAAIIAQSVRYVGCSDLELLKDSIDYFNELKRIGLLYNISEIAFQTERGLESTTNDK